MAISKINAKTQSRLANQVLDFMNRNKLVLSGEFVTTPQGARYTATVQRATVDFYDGSKKLQEIGIQKRGFKYPEPLEFSGSSLTDVLVRFARKTSNRVISFVDSLDSFSVKVPNFFEQQSKAKRKMLLY